MKFYYLMKSYLSLIILTLLSCQNNSKHEIIPTKPVTVKSVEKPKNCIFQCESNHFISRLEEIPNRDKNAFSLTITSKDTKIKFTKILDTPPGMSKIRYCNDLYTAVGFPCGGPCYSRVFVFTDKNRDVEQYGYPQVVKNNINIIGHIKDEEFENLIIHNLLNSKEIIVHLPDNNPWNYGQVDSMFVKNDNLILYYISKNKKSVTKTVKLKGIL